MRMMQAMCAALGLAVAGGSALASDVVREGAGERRAQLDAMEMRPAPAGLWNTLEGGPTATELEGNVVVVYTFSSWYRPSTRPQRMLEALGRRHADDGLVVLGVHHQRGFEASQHANSRVAHDAAGTFREMLLVDQDPDIYVFDRAGQLRYADIETGSAAAAIRELLAESPGEAAGTRERRSAARSAARQDARRVTAMNARLLDALDEEVPFSMPDSSAYEAVEWPEHNDGLSAKSVQGQPLPRADVLQTVSWFSEKPETRGRVVVLDFWATWCGPCIAAMPMLDEMQRSNEDELALIAITKPDRGQDKAKVRNFVNGKSSSYFNAWDADGTMSSALEIRGIPHVVVVSSDGVVRWQGNPHQPAFRAAVAKTIANDPGVAARMEAREAHIKRIKEQAGE